MPQGRGELLSDRQGPAASEWTIMSSPQQRFAARPCDAWRTGARGDPQGPWSELLGVWRSQPLTRAAAGTHSRILQAARRGASWWADVSRRRARWRCRTAFCSLDDRRMRTLDARSASRSSRSIRMPTACPIRVRRAIPMPSWSMCCAATATAACAENLGPQAGHRSSPATSPLRTHSCFQAASTQGPSPNSACTCRPARATRRSRLVSRCVLRDGRRRCRPRRSQT
jgi:hypothetical protein